MLCIVLGDSISEGIGSKKENYIKYLQEMNPKIQFRNLSKTGTTIEYAETLLEDIKTMKPQYIIIMYGSVDAQIRPNIKKNRFAIWKMIPKRYKIGGMLDPRAFYSKKWYRIIPDRIDNCIRWILKRLMVLTQGKMQYVNIGIFEEKYDRIVKIFSEQKIKCIMVSTMYLDDKYFLNSNIEYKKYNEIIKKIALKYNQEYVNLFDIISDSIKKFGWREYYSHDHFHPNERGYEFIANQLQKYLDNKRRSETH